ncbi:alpha/beta hydrolase [Streptomyces muensis]|uniref:Alpha/beta hydrolase n=1 Tax=Streptomyces muensis TaxID=1077944 RepID=A0A9X1PU68_STRM4|nr:alpha/beta hydrolase family protein [Streptomyces muensis]MCF1592595.1 alpha/beta hydrolase [Streptomyces muensis]
MTTYVLLHGGGMGGWVWRHVAAPLRTAGHEVLTPTFTGFGERVHLLSKDHGHDVNVQDVIGVLRYEDVRDAVLVGHSYAGSVIPGVVAQEGDRVRHIVYLDAMMSRSGESVFETMGYATRDELPGIRAAIQAGQAGPGTGVHLQERQRLTAAPFDMPTERQEWLLDHLSDMPMRVVTDPVAVGVETLPHTTDYIVAKNDPTMATSQERAVELGWQVHEWKADHGFIIGRAGELADFLLSHG